MRTRVALVIAAACACVVETPGYLGPAEGGEPCSPRADAGMLAQASAELAPGEWGELASRGFVESLLGRGGDWVATYTHTGLWDPRRGQLTVVGSDLLRYDAASNAWSADPDKPPGCGCDEGLDHSALDPASSTVYVRNYGSAEIHARVGDGPWAALPPIPAIPGQCCNGLEYFPPRDELLFADISGLFVFSEGTWAHLYGDLDISDFGIIVYDPVDRLALLTGGTAPGLYVYDADGGIDARAAAPVALDVRSVRISPDLVSGNFIVLADPGRMFEYDALADRWSELPGVPPPFSATRSMMALDFVVAPISDTCVSMYMAYDFDASTVLLHRHGP